MPRKKQQKRKEEMGLVEVKVTVGKGIDGKPLRKSFYGPTKKQAKEKADAYILKSKVFDNLRPASFSEAAEQWMSVFKEDAVRTITYERSYRSPFEKHVLPYFQNAYISDIKQTDIQKFFNSKSQYSFSYLQKMRNVLNGVFEFAIANSLCYYNPVKGTRLGKSSTETITDKRAYSYAESRQMVEFAKTARYGMDAIILLKTGLRRSELLALRWDNVDMKNRVIHVRESVSETNSGLEIHPCKSKKSIRDIPFDNELFSLFFSMERTGFVIKGKNGKNMVPHNWSYKRYGIFVKQLACAGLDIPALNPHELRHSFGSVLYERGVDIVTISKLMGHASIDITVKLYVHDSMRKKIEAVSKLA